MKTPNPCADAFDNATLRHLADCIDGQPTEECLEWLKNGFKRFVAGESLEKALGLTGLHSRGPRFAYKYALMERHIIEAASLIAESTNWARAELLATEMKDVARHWQKWVAKGLPPHATHIERHLFNAHQARNGDVPDSACQIYAILCKDGIHSK